jgi:sec-independent protein translocase protein TatB
MIDLGLTKIAIIGAVALVVIGPERLPKVARMAGTLYGRAQRYLHEVKTEVSREIEMEELRHLQKEVQDSAQQFQSEIEKTVSDNLGDLKSGWSDAPAWTPPRATMSDLERKAREFRRKKIVRNSAVPGWYKKQHGGRTHVISGAARVKRFRPRASTRASFF